MVLGWRVEEVGFVGLCFGVDLVGLIVFVGVLCILMVGCDTNLGLGFVWWFV